MCSFKWEFLENADPQTSQENGFSPMSVCMCSFKGKFLENAEPHTSQGNAFSPVWFLMWHLKYDP